MMKIFEIVQPQEMIYVDNWRPMPEDIVFNQVKGAIILPVSRFFGVENAERLDFFKITKKSHNSAEMREHCVHYLNYFIKFYDPERELVSIYCKLKYLIDLEDNYTKKDFLHDIDKYILHSMSIMSKVTHMNRDNYTLSLKYKCTHDPVLEYTDKHGSLMMKISLLMNIIIPLAGHFIDKNKLSANIFILEVFDRVLHLFEHVDIYNKLYETSNSNITKSTKHHPLWKKQDIRGKNTTTHTLDSVNNIIINIMPKYTYDKNIISFNFTSIKNNIQYQVTDIGYEFDFIPLSSSKRDEDNNSEFDKFESYLTKQDEALYLQNKVNCSSTMEHLERVYGPFDQAEIDFYIKELGSNDKVVINSFQKELIFNLFYKYFGDPMSIKAINRDDYIKLIIIAKKILQSNNMVILPYILSSKINRLVSRKSINKKELLKIEASPYYTLLVNKYKNEKIQKQILSIIATILSSEFQIIDFENPELNGKPIDTIPEYISEEVMIYISLI